MFFLFIIIIIEEKKKFKYFLTHFIVVKEPKIKQEYKRSITNR
jgi:hypothetical protein